MDPALAREERRIRPRCRHPCTRHVHTSRNAPFTILLYRIQHDLMLTHFLIARIVRADFIADFASPHFFQETRLSTLRTPYLRQPYLRQERTPRVLQLRNGATYGPLCHTAPSARRRVIALVE